MYSWPLNIMAPLINGFLKKVNTVDPFCICKFPNCEFNQLQIKKSIFAFPQQIPSSSYPDADAKCCLDYMWLNLWMQMAAVESKVSLVFSTVRWSAPLTPACSRMNWLLKACKRQYDKNWILFCWRRLSRGWWQPADQLAGSGQLAAPYPLSYPWNVHPTHSSCISSCFQECGLERAMCCWDKMVWLCVWT